MTCIIRPTLLVANPYVILPLIRLAWWTYSATPYMQRERIGSVVVDTVTGACRQGVKLIYASTSQESSLASIGPSDDEYTEMTVFLSKLWIGLGAGHCEVGKYLGRADYIVLRDKMPCLDGYAWPNTSSIWAQMPARMTLLRFAPSPTGQLHRLENGVVQSFVRKEG
jgi:hypothetical protein